MSKPWKCPNYGLETRGFGIYSHRRKCKSFEEKAHAELDAHERDEVRTVWNRVNREMADHLDLGSDQNIFDNRASCRCIANQYLWLADHAAKFIADRMSLEEWTTLERHLRNASVLYASNRGTELVHESLRLHFARTASKSR